MNGDQAAQLQQLHASAKALRITISSIRSAGADHKLIDMARIELVYVVKLTAEAITRKGVS